MSVLLRARLVALAMAIVIAGVASSTATTASPAAPDRAQAAVWEYRAAHPGAPVPVIVQTATGSDPQTLVQAAGAQVTADLGMIHAVAARVAPARLEALTATPGVAWVSLDGAVTSTSGGDSTPSSNVFRTEVQADLAADAGLRGQGVGVAIVDTGIYAAGDFSSSGKSRVVATFAKDGTTGVDGYGHGTHVAGLAGGDGDYPGVAPKVNLISVKVGDNTGAATVSDVIAGLQFVLANKERYNIRVVNLSLRSNSPQSYTTDPLDAAVELLTFRGILVVAAAGNTGTAADAVSYSPGNDPFVLTVGALDDLGTERIADDVVPVWSSRGTTQDGFAKPELYAPGRHLVSVLSPGSVLATQLPGSLIGSHYLSLSGTSMAAAVTSGAAALVFNAHPEWTPGQVKAALVQTGGTVASDPSVRVAQAYSASRLPAPVDPTPNTKPNTLLLRAAGIANPASISWGSVSWGSISWGSVSWGSVSWGSVSWGSVSWGNVRD